MCFGNEEGFTLIELIMVIVIIGILASVAAQRMITAAEQAEITTEDMTVDIMRSNLIINLGNDLIQGRPAEFPDNPFSNLSKIPEGFDRRRTTRPTGEAEDDGLWMYARERTGGNLTAVQLEQAEQAARTGTSLGSLAAEQAGTTLATFQTDGFIYHQRKDRTIVRWAYDSSQGVIGKKIIRQESEIKKRLDEDRLLRGEPIERDKLDRIR
ncbi:MAG: prepilin-type N-terminal cleavage/methylation domain-containing protein [Nitrospinae bacterium]|nr:prepilin-type N-terminal cleavage/methylation domain-containing protein [Nitrospinota bacterium]